MAQNFVSGEVIRADLKTFYEKPVARVSLELVFSLLTVMFFALFALRPTLNTMSQLVKEIEDKQKIDDALTKKIAALSTAQGEYLTYQERFKVLDTAIHSNLKLDDVLFTLEYMAGKSEIHLTGLRIRQFPVGQIGGEEPVPLENESTGKAGTVPKTPQTIGIYQISVSFTGEYQKMLNFFAALESSRPLFSVQGLSFSTRRDKDSNYQLTAASTIYAYGYLDEAVKTDTKLEKVAPKADEVEL